MATQCCRNEETQLASGWFCGLDTTTASAKNKNAAARVVEAPEPIPITTAALGSFDQPSDPDKDHCTDEGHNNRTNHPSSRPQAEQPENPASNDTPENT